MYSHRYSSSEEQEKQLEDDFTRRREQVIRQIAPQLRTYTELAQIVVLLSNWCATVETYFLPQASILAQQNRPNFLAKIQSELADLKNGIRKFQEMRDNAVPQPPIPIIPPMGGSFTDYLEDQRRRTQRMIDISVGNCVVCHRSLRGVPIGTICPYCGRYQDYE